MADPFKHTLRKPEAYRDDRLDAEQQRLERRLDALADEALDDIAPGKTPGRLERWKLY